MVGLAGLRGQQRQQVVVGHAGGSIRARAAASGPGGMSARAATSSTSVTCRTYIRAPTIFGADPRCYRRERHPPIAEVANAHRGEAVKTRWSRCSCVPSCPSDRFGAELRALLERDGVPERVVTAPDLDSGAENHVRLGLLTGTVAMASAPGCSTASWTTCAGSGWPSLQPTSPGFASSTTATGSSCQVLPPGRRRRPAHPRRRGPVRPSDRLDTEPGAEGRGRCPVPAAHSGHHRSPRRRGGAGGPYSADRFLRSRPPAAGGGGPGRVIGEDEPRGCW